MPVTILGSRDDVSDLRLTSILFVLATMSAGALGSPQADDVALPSAEERRRCARMAYTILIGINAMQLKKTMEAIKAMKVKIKKLKAMLPMKAMKTKK